MTRIAAIDLSKHNARYIVVETTLRRAELVTAEVVHRDPEEPIEEFLVRVKAALPENIDSLVVDAPTTNLSTRLLSFPFTDTRKIEQTLEFELENQVPYDLDNITTTYEITERSKTHTTVLTALSPKDPLREQLAALHEAGLEPRSLLVPGAALAELLTVKSPEPVAIAYLGGSDSHVTVVGQNGLRFTRPLRAGGLNVDRTLARNMKVHLGDARALKESGRIFSPGELGTEEEERHSLMLTAGLAPLVTQLASTFKSLPESAQPMRLVLTGGLSRLPGLSDHISRELGLDTELLDLTNSLGGIESERHLAPEFAIALGMMHGIMRRGRGIPLNLRRGEFAYSGDIQLYRGEITRIAAGIAIVMMLAIIASVMRYSMVTSVESQLDAAFCEVTKRIVGREICDPTAALATLKATPGAEAGVVIPEYSAATLFEMMSKAVGTDIDIAFQQLDFRMDSGSGEPDTISGKGDASSFEGTDQLIAALKKDKCVEEAEISKQKKGKNDRVEFNLKVRVRCPAGSIPGGELEQVAAVAPPPPTPTAGEAEEEADAPSERAPLKLADGFNETRKEAQVVKSGNAKPFRGLTPLPAPGPVRSKRLEQLKRGNDVDSGTDIKDRRLRSGRGRFGRGSKGKRGPMAPRRARRPGKGKRKRGKADGGN